MGSITGDYVWIPPVYDIENQPTLTSQTNLVQDPAFPQNFARIAKWAPDGSTALLQCENRSFQAIRIQSSADEPSLESSSRSSAIGQAHHNTFYLSQPPDVPVMSQPGPIVDYAWFPHATIQDPASFCFAASVRECPVRLLDASSGRLRASYRIVDHRERQIAPHSLAFNAAGSKLYCGFQDAIEVFDVNTPGEGTRLPTTPSRKSRDGLKGVISSIAFCPSYDPSSNYFAAGSLSPSSSMSSNIALYSEDTGSKAIGWIGDVRASVMQLAFNPMKPHILYSSFRRHGAIYAWDLRVDTSIPSQTFALPDDQRSATNQKMRFDIDISGQWMAVGSQGGNVNVFSLNEPPTVENGTVGGASRPVLEYHAHEDAVGSVAFHPLQPLLLSISGSRHFTAGDEAHSDREGQSESESDSDGTPVAAVVRPRARLQPTVVDNSVRLWGFAT